MKKVFLRTLSLILSMIMVISVLQLGGFVGLSLSDFSFRAAATEILYNGDCGENLKFTLDADGVLTISGTGTAVGFYEGNGNWNQSWQTVEKSGTYIYIMDSIKKIVIKAENLKEIGGEAFRNSKITEFDTGNIERIDYRAFDACAELKSFHIGSALTYGAFPFLGCSSLEKLTVDKNNPYYFAEGNCLLQRYYFDWSTDSFDKSNEINSVIWGIKTSVIPESAKEIADNAFSGSEIEKIHIPANITYISLLAFYNALNNVKSITVDEKNPVYKAKGNCLYNITSSYEGYFLGNENTLLFGCKNSVIPDDGSITRIGQEAFNHCSDLENLIIPNTITSIGGYAFRNAGLKTLHLPASVVEADVYSFSSMPYLENISVDKNNPKFTALSNCLINKTKKEIVLGFSNSTIPTDPDIVTSIGEYSFSNISGLKEMDIPENINRIGFCAFYFCGDLETIKFHDGLIEIGANAFYGTKWYDNQSGDYIYAGKNLLMFNNYESKTVDKIKKGTLSIASCCFDGKNLLESVTIPDSVQSIGGYAFAGCTSLSTVKLGTGLKRAGSKVFTDTPWYENQPDGLIYAGKVLLGYKGEIPDNYELNKIRDDTVAVADEAFMWKFTLKSLALPESVVYVGDKAFFDCWPESVVVFNPDCEFYSEGSLYTETIVAPKGGKVQDYAKNNGIRFYPLVEKPQVIFDLYEGDSYKTGDIFGVRISVLGLNEAKSVVSGSMSFKYNPNLLSLSFFDICSEYREDVESKWEFGYDDDEEKGILTISFDYGLEKSFYYEPVFEFGFRAKKSGKADFTFGDKPAIKDVKGNIIEAEFVNKSINIVDNVFNEIFVDEWTEIADEDENVDYFKFIPKEDGYYRFYVKTDIENASAVVLDSDFNLVGEVIYMIPDGAVAGDVYDSVNNEFYFEAGKVYYISDDMPCQIRISFVKAPPTEEPTEIPTEKPTEKPTEAPTTEKPIDKPSETPSEAKKPDYNKLPVKTQANNEVLLISDSLTSKQVKETLSEFTVNILDINGNKLEEDAAIGTGTVIEIYDGEKLIEKKTVIVKGDINGDGKVKTTDARNALRGALGLDNLSDAQILAADVNNDGKLKATDARAILRGAMGLDDTAAWLG
jgi:hypothetical protein